MLMTLSEAIKTRILNLCKERNITVNKLATLSGLYQSTVNNILLGFSQSPKAITVYRICQGLNIELHEFYNDKLFKNLDDD